MGLHVAFLGKSFPTNFTLERLFPSVYQHVHIQSRFVPERFPTERANMSPNTRIWKWEESKNKFIFITIYFKYYRRYGSLGKQDANICMKRRRHKTFSSKHIRVGIVKRAKQYYQYHRPLWQCAGLWSGQCIHKLVLAQWPLTNNDHGARKKASHWPGE